MPYPPSYPTGYQTQYPQYIQNTQPFQTYPNYIQPAQVSQQPQQTPNIPTQQLQIQNGGFISVRNEQEARNYPVAPGNSITFKNETAPYVYTKTMGFSQLDRPHFVKYRLVEEVNDIDISKEQYNIKDENIANEYALKKDIDIINQEIESLKVEIETFREKSNEEPLKKVPVKSKKDEKAGNES